MLLKHLLELRIICFIPNYLVGLFINKAP